jgi:hypothetical protein
MPTEGLNNLLSQVPNSPYISKPNFVTQIDIAEEREEVSTNPTSSAIGSSSEIERRPKKNGHVLSSEESTRIL